MKPKAHVTDLEHLQLAIAAAGVTLWTWNVDSDELTMDAAAFKLWGVAKSSRVTFAVLCLSQIKSERIGDAVRPGLDGKEWFRLCEYGVMSGHPCPTISACAPHCSNSCTTAERDEDAAR